MEFPWGVLFLWDWEGVFCFVLFCFANVDVPQSQSPEKEQQQRARVSTRPAFTSSFSREMKSATETDKISHAAEQESRQSFQGE